MELRDTVDIDFCTLGMFIIGGWIAILTIKVLIEQKDDIEFPAPTEAVNNILGGAGSWSALGARLFSPPPKSKSVGWVVDAGSDFPVELRQTIQSWETSCVLRETPNRKTTRGRNIYGENEERGESAVNLRRASKPQTLQNLICGPCSGPSIHICHAEIAA